MNIFLLKITLLTTYSLAETGKFNASGAGSWTTNVMNAGNGNMSITYDGNAGLSDKENGSIFDKYRGINDNVLYDSITFGSVL